MGIAMVAMLAFGGTFAYFTASAGSAIAPASGVTTATLALSTGTGAAITATQGTDKVVPGDKLFEANIALTTTGTNTGVYIFATWVLDDGGLPANSLAVTTGADGEGWVDAAVSGSTVLYKKLEAAEAANGANFTASVTLNTTVKATENTMNKTVTCSVKFDMVQSRGLAAGATPAQYYALIANPGSIG